MGEKRCRAYLITSNNPEKYYDWAKIDYRSAKESDYEKVINNAINQFVKGDKNHKNRDPKINGAVGVFEVGLESRTPHFHLLCTSKNPIRFGALQKRFPHSQIDVLRGSISDVLDYLHKRRKHSDKADTLKCEPVYWGECFVDNRGLSGNRTFEAIEEMLEDGHSPSDIYSQSVKLAFYAAAIERTYSARRMAEIPFYQDVYVEMHLGGPGTGKTFNYLKMCHEGLADRIYFVSGDYKNPWDGYDLARHSILFLDEMRGNSLSTSMLLGITDGYRMTLPARYSNRQKNWNHVVISTVVPPEDLFNDSFYGSKRSKRDSFQQFKRRLNTIVYHFIDPSEEGDSKYKTVSIPAEQYESYSQLEELAAVYLDKNRGTLC
jgi:hypothetical protein